MFVLAPALLLTSIRLMAGSICGRLLEDQLLDCDDADAKERIQLRPGRVLGPFHDRLNYLLIDNL